MRGTHAEKNPYKKPVPIFQRIHNVHHIVRIPAIFISPCGFENYITLLLILKYYYILLYYNFILNEIKFWTNLVMEKKKVLFWYFEFGQKEIEMEFRDFIRNRNLVWRVIKRNRARRTTSRRTDANVMVNVGLDNSYWYSIHTTTCNAKK